MGKEVHCSRRESGAAGLWGETEVVDWEEVILRIAWIFIAIFGISRCRRAGNWSNIVGSKSIRLLNSLWIV